MRRKDITYRITKIGNKAVSVSVCGLSIIAATSASAAVIRDVKNDLPTTTISLTTDSVVYEYLNVSNASDTYTGNIEITVSRGFDLTGNTTVGTTPVAIYTRPKTDGSSTDFIYFSGANTNSTLTLLGGNELDGQVGVTLNESGSTYDPDPIDIINVNDSGVTFSNRVFANIINVNTGGDLEFRGLISGNTGSTINLNNNDIAITFNDNVTLEGSITNSPNNTSGTLIFNKNSNVTGSIGSATTGLDAIQVKGAGSTVRIGGDLSTDHLMFNTTATVAVGGNLYLNAEPNVGNNLVSFGSTNSTLQVGGNLTGAAGQIVVSTATPNTGTLTFISGNQSVTGNLGSGSLPLYTVNIGGTGSGAGLDTSTNVSSTTNVSGNIFAQTIRLNNDNSNASKDSTLILDTGFNLTGAVVTEQNLRGNLTLAGGIQTVTGQVGASDLSLNTVTSGSNGANSTFTSDVFSKAVNNAGSGRTTFLGNVTATTVDVGNGDPVVFTKNLTAVTTTINDGTANFSTTAGSTTTTNISITGSGDANLYQGLTGNISFGASSTGTVNLFDSKTISGAVFSASGVNGTLNVLGAGTLESAVTNLTAVNINRRTDSALGETDGISKLVVANGSIQATDIKFFNNGTVQLADGVNLSGTITTTTRDTGNIIAVGNSTISGNVGTNQNPIGLITAGATGKTVVFNNGTVYAEELLYSGNGTVRINGSNPTTATTDYAFGGIIDFGAGRTGKLELGDNVDLKTSDPSSNTTTVFQNSSQASIRFLGNSTVSGDLGSTSNRFDDVFAGADGKTVTFNGSVYVGPSTFHVTGNGTVNMLGNIDGPLLYDQDGTVNIANNKNITGGVLTTNNLSGTLNFVGNATTASTIGAVDKQLKAVNFHSVSSDTDVLPVTTTNASINIGHGVYAANTTIGTSLNASRTDANVTANVFLGNSVTLKNSNVTLNTAGMVTSNTVSVVDFPHFKSVDGTLDTVANVTKSSFGTGTFTTNNATINFAIGTTAWNATLGGGLIDAPTSSRITGGTGSQLVMSGGETVNVALLGSVRNGQTYTLIDANVSGGTQLPSTLRDNSFVIQTTLSRSSSASGEDLVLTATRSNSVYTDKSLTSGHFSNPAALRLGTLAAGGTNYSTDLQTSLNKLDIDQWGYGNNATNLATQVKRLAPIANNSLVLSAFNAASLVGDGIGVRLHQLRIPESARPYEAKGIWVRTLNQRGRQDSIDYGSSGFKFDGFKTSLSGITLGFDAYPNRDALVGVALSYSNTNVKQSDFRSGDDASLTGYHFSLYGSYNFTPEFYAGLQLTSSRVATKGNRSTAVGEVAKFDYDSNQMTGRFDLGYRVKLGASAMYITPMLSVESSRLTPKDYEESGAGGLGLRVNAETLTRSRVTSGLKLDGTLLAGGIILKPEIAFVGFRDYGKFTQPISAQYLGDLSNDAVFVTDVAEYRKKGGFGLSLGMGVLLNKSSSMFVKYEHTYQGKDKKRSTDGYTSDNFELLLRWNYY